ncbi:hypothetical protein [Bradyrhizobium icense]|uniref:Uncharacterized protein n=1 Tax=Bradyrhizobium icense TaxID=1274631 RepID=A0A1B1UJ69_9BRAD|nr:hypothetical protein [Bradyrhizobium icense]ANW02839.1 hypothetical protein LMTR13_24465 [Bradyrhizobium icense]
MGWSECLGPHLRYCGCEVKHTGFRFLRLTSTQYQREAMRAFTFACPITNMMVQKWLDADAEATEREFQGVVCPACSQLHFISRKTGKLLGQKEK